MGLLDGKVIVISGVGIGMGQRMVRLAVQEGAKVAFGARNDDFIQSVAKSVRDEGGEAIAVRTDVTKVEDCRRLADEAEKAFGRIDGLINSAYMHGEWKPTDVANVEEYGKIFDVNCVGAIRMAQSCLPAMKRAGGGAIVNISTMSTVNPFSGEGGYSAGKGGLNALTKHMAKDFGKHNIRVNYTRMGWIGGEPVEQFLDRQVAAGHKREDIIAGVTAQIPLGIIPPEEDCARAVLFFVSDYSKVVNGASLDVNGGQYMAP